MTIKIGNKKVGENPEEQRKLEKKRFEAREKRKTDEIETKREKLIEMGKGNKTLDDFKKEDAKN